ncbi:hypothetical protein ABZ922_29280 [Streptomyces shenzhenensis]|uniref:hypothetical protein n=1 Tax=Streptomyces shenzhenensis TaxID=943815 RepID=UPI003410D6A9
MPFGRGNREQLRSITEQLTQITTGLAALEQQVTGQQHTLDQMQYHTKAQPAHPNGQEPDLDTLRAAAGISAAVLHAHRDMWEFLVKHAGADQHFHVPGKVCEADGVVIVHVSGPSLVAILTSLGQVKQDSAAGIGTQALAHHLHQRISRIVKGVAADPVSGDQGNPVEIRIDDRPKPPEDNTARP